MTLTRRRCAIVALLVTCGSTRVSAQHRFGAVDAAVREGISRGTYPGAVVVIGRADTILYAKGYGRFTWSRTSRTPDPGTTLWDLASLSKIVGTASAMAVLVGDQRLDLDAPVPQYLPEFVGVGKDHVTVRMLLNHTSGLPAYAPLYRSPTSDSAVARLLSIPLTRAVGARPIYSDLNAMLAGLVVERISGQSLDTFARTAVFAPLGMHATTYRLAAADQLRAAPTSRVRGRSVAGVVNDENARRLDGVAGHAGIFSTGMDIARFAQSWLRVTALSAPWVNASTLISFFERTPESGARALGWDTPEPRDDGSPSVFGRCATESTFGHTGWTGTEVWLDREQDLFVVFLTNRSYAPRAPAASFTRLRNTRAKVSDAARRAMGGCEGGRPTVG